MKIGLGTVQFGLNYGIANAAGQVGEEEVRAILAMAQDAGIRVLDTAAAYGRAEAVLGAVGVARRPFRIITKLPRLPEGLAITEMAGWVGDTVAASCAKLGRERLDGLLVHHAQDLLGARGHALWAQLAELRGAGHVERIGASVYEGAEIDALLDRYEPDLVQLPINVIDQRLIAGGQLRRLNARHVEVHARSVFLQGLLLLPPERVPARITGARAAVERFHGVARAAGLTPLAAALAFVNALPEVDCMIVGVTRAAELREILECASLELEPGAFAACASSDEALLNPARWPQP